MRPVILDTNAYVGFKRGDGAIIDIIQHAQRIGVSPIVVGELLGGFEHGKKVDQNRKELQEFLESSRVVIFPITTVTANFYALVYANLRKKGKPIPTNDLWIAAQALENGCALCSYDKHFNQVEGLLVGKQLSDLFF